MGNGNSSSSANEAQHVQQANENNNSLEYVAVRDPELRYLRRSLKKDQEAFILNNLMLCIRFFENYEREIQEIRSSPVSRREEDVNTILSQSHKHVLLPGVLEEQVSSHVKFTSTRLTNCESTIEPLQPVRMYVVLDNVNVNEATDGSNDNLLPYPIFYKMRTEPSSNHGYVRLRLLDVRVASKEQITDSSEAELPFIAEDDDEICNEKDDLFNPKMNPSTQQLLRVGKRAGKMSGKSTCSQSMNNLDNVDEINGEAAPSEIGRTQAQKNLGLLEHRDDEGYQEPPYSGSKQSKQLKMSRRSIDSIPRSSRSSGYKSGSSERNSVTDSDSDYGYATITSSNTSKSSAGESNLPTSSSEIPASCFKEFVFTRDGKVCIAKAKRTEPRNAKEKKTRKTELQSQNAEHSYLRSHKFRRYFKNMFVNRLAKPLGFVVEDDSDVTRQGAIIHCYSMKVLEGNPAVITPHEIVPSLSAEWPECCREWLDRSRRALLDFPSEEVWLTKEMIDEVERLGCHIIPESYTPTKDTNPYHAAEWQLNFPAGERYLETCLSHPQAHVYMVALMLHRTFIRSTDATFGLTTSHIRSQLFSLFEENCSSSMWSENRGGERLRELMKRLYGSVSHSQPCLEDYFIRKKNLFENIPRQYLHLTQKQIRRIIDNPVMYLIASMKNVRYKPDFYPILDYKRLYTLLTIDDRDLVAFVSPDLNRADNPTSQAQKEELDKYEERFDRIEGFLYDPSQKISRQEDESKNASRELVVQITDECAELEGLRLNAVLNLFIEHFTKMAECCHRYGTIEQKDTYLNQAQRLSLILRDQAYGKEDAMRYLDTINTLKDKLKTDGSRLETSVQENHAAISVPLNQYFTDEPQRQRLTLLQSNIGETNEFHIHHNPEPIVRRPTVTFKLEELTSL